MTKRMDVACSVRFVYIYAPVALGKVDLIEGITNFILY